MINPDTDFCYYSRISGLLSENDNILKNCLILITRSYRGGVSSALALGDVRRAGWGDPPALCGVLVRVMMGAGVQRAGRGWTGAVVRVWVTNKHAESGSRAEVTRTYKHTPCRVVKTPRWGHAANTTCCGIMTQTLLTDKVTAAELKVTDWSQSKHNQISLLSIVALYLIKASLHFIRQH